MSTDFRLSETLRFSDLLDGRLEKFGVREQITPHTSDEGKCLTDGDNFLWIYANEGGFISLLTRNGANDPNRILGTIAEAFIPTSIRSTNPSSGASTRKRSGMRGSEHVGKSTISTQTF